MKKFFNYILKHKKPVIIACLALIIGVSVYTDFVLNNKDNAEITSNYIYNSDVSEMSDTAGSSKILGEAKLVDNITNASNEYDSYFANASDNRERSRDEALETLQVVIDSSESMPSVKDEALSRMINIASNIETEALVEEMVKAKGFSDCIAVINNESINVVVKSPGLLDNEVAQITEIVIEETGFAPQNIKIVNKE